MANGETDARREPSAADIRRRGDKLQVTLAKIELAMDGLVAVDRLLVLNQALTNVLQDEGGRALISGRPARPLIAGSWHGIAMAGRRRRSPKSWMYAADGIQRHRAFYKGAQPSENW